MRPQIYLAALSMLGFACEPPDPEQTDAGFRAAPPEADAGIPCNFVGTDSELQYIELRQGELAACDEFFEFVCGLECRPQLLCDVPRRGSCAQLTCDQRKFPQISDSIECLNLQKEAAGCTPDGEFSAGEPECRAAPTG